MWKAHICHKNEFECTWAMGLASPYASLHAPSDRTPPLIACMHGAPHNLPPQPWPVAWEANGRAPHGAPSRAPYLVTGSLLMVTNSPSNASKFEGCRVSIPLALKRVLNSQLDANPV